MVWGLGDRVSQTVNGITTNFVLDLNSGLTQVLQESAPQGYGAYTYLYGTDRIAQYGATSTEYFLGDALGSVRQMVDASGAVVLAKSYDPFGNAKASTGTGASRYGYTGEQSDSYINLIYLRSRYYYSGWTRHHAIPAGDHTLTRSWPGRSASPGRG